MSKLQILTFCAAALLLSLGTAVLLYPSAAMSQKEMARAHSAQPMEDLADINLGPEFGRVPVTELVGYYIEHPPQPKSVGVLKREQHFGGC